MPNREERRKRREERKKMSAEVKAKWQEVRQAISNSKIEIDLDKTEPKFVDAFNQVWPVLKPVLEYAKAARITGVKADKKIQAVIDLGERISTGKASKDEQSGLVKILDKVWGKVKLALTIVVAIADEKVDEVLNRIIEIGDWITEDAKV